MQGKWMEGWGLKEERGGREEKKERGKRKGGNGRRGRTMRPR